MIIKEKIGHLSSYHLKERVIDYLPVEWYESRKRILLKKTIQGREMVLKFLGETQNLQQDDVLFADDNVIVAVEMLHCEVMVLKPKTMYEMALLSYEIGNKHLPLFYENGELLIPYDMPTFRILEVAGYQPVLQHRKLSKQLQTTVTPHAHAGGGESLFSKLMKLTTANE